MRRFAVRYHAAQRRYLDEHDPEASADIVVDTEDPARPALVRVAGDLHLPPHLRSTRRLFAPRAAGWNAHFHDDGPRYAAAAAELAPRAGGTVVDVGWGAGRARVPLREAIGPVGTVLGVDATPEMLDAARHGATEAKAALVLADVTRLPFARGSVDALFAAGLLSHVPDVRALLVHLAEIVGADGRLAVFQPIGRAALARRHQRELRPDELLDPSVLPGVLAAAGWATERIDDADDRYLALAFRKGAGT
jgi:SAM-dependent methyltransferase